MSGYDHRVAGKRLSRLDGVGKVTGKHVYAADFVLPGMLFARILRSPVARARVVRLDVAKALALPGVRTILTARDVPIIRFGTAIKDRPMLADGEVRFVGEAIAAVAATTLEIATQAIGLIEVEYEELPAVFDPEAAMADSAPLVHPQWNSYQALPVFARDGNVPGRCSLGHGDVEAGFAASYRVYEHRFTSQLVHPGYTEPRAAVASWDGNGDVIVWTNTQLPFDMKNMLAEVLDLPAGKVRVIVPGIGGGFGGKLRVGVEHFAAWLARKSRRPVKVMTTSEEELLDAYPRQPTIVTLKTGVARDGTLLARKGQVIIDCGAYANSGPATAAVALQVLNGPYRTANLQLEGIAVYTNKGATGSFRAPAGPMANFAVESQIDMIADDLGLDPLEMRLSNAFCEGDSGPAGEKLASVSIAECLTRAAEAIGWKDRKPGSGRGKGIACSWWMTTGGSSGVYVKINAEGTVTLVSGAVEIGTGALTGAAQVLAEELGIDLADVSVADVDTESTPFDYGAQGSRTAFSVGNACRVAAADLRRQVFEIAAQQWQVPVDGMRLEGKAVVLGNKRLTLADIAAASLRSGGGLISHGTVIQPMPTFDPGRVKNHPLPAWTSPSYHAHAVDLSVDDVTGEVSINRYVVVQDVGYAINPTYIEGQIEGGVTQGIGQTLSEEIVYRDGRVLNANLTDYKMPTAMDAPRIESILVQSPSVNGPYGAKGVGEPPCIQPPAAIANAIAVATGVRVQTLPITAEKIALARLDEAG
ncbi:xanthine dehydrogenase family protein molybdopterin-binding subunit [Reyranella sp.]|uniref:xanthine dehydrogenase family protein molybdopterin-binding subunit n=1 Tax=Reyranella sp. TaxID=1929291 RepID=UPI0037832DDF